MKFSLWSIVAIAALIICQVNVSTEESSYDSKEFSIENEIVEPNQNETEHVTELPINLATFSESESIDFNDESDSVEAGIIVNEAIVGVVELDPEDILPSFFSTILEDKADILEALIDQVLSNEINIDLNEVSLKYKYNALHFAAMNGKLECLRVIIRRIESFNFDIDDKSGDENGNTALFLACYNANYFTEVAVGVVQHLLESGADTNSVNSVNDEEYSLLFAAIIGSDAGVVSLLLDEWNADINYALPIFNDTVLHIAMESCSRPVMKVLIEKGADVHAVNYYNREPIHEAAALGCVDGLRELILTRRIDRHHPSPRRNEKQEYYDECCLFEATPLHFAARFTQLPAIEFLFLIKSDFFAKDEDERTAEYYSSMMRAENNKSTVEVNYYFIDRLDWERNEILVYGVRDTEDLIRSLDSNPCPERLKHYMRVFLHDKRTLNDF